jgi:hypothetical protein
LSFEYEGDKEKVQIEVCNHHQALQYLAKILKEKQIIIDISEI